MSYFKNKINSTYVILVFVFFVCPIIAQQRKIDSLRSVYFSNQPDTIRIQALNDLIWPIYANSAPDSGIKYAHLAIELAKKNNALHKLTVTLRRLAICYNTVGDYKLSLKYHNESLELARKIKSDKDIAIALGNIGVVYMDIGDQTKALNYNLQSIELKERLKDYKTVQNNYYNVGLLYKDLGELDKAQIAVEKSIKISKLIKDDATLSVGYNGLGIIYKNKKDFAKAKYYYYKAIEITLSLNDEHKLADNYVNIGSLYSDTKQYDSSIFYLNKSVRISHKINYRAGESAALSNLAFVNIQLKKFKDVIKNAELSIATNSEGLGNTEFCYMLLVQANGELGDYKKAFYYQTLRTNLNDSLEKTNQKRDLIKLQIQNDYDKKLLADSVKYAEQEKVASAEIKVINAKLNQEKTARYSLIIGLIVLILFSYFIFTRFRLIKKQNSIIEHQKKETEEQKTLIEEKQKEILDSINYAKRIQYALLASDNLLQTHLPDYFILFKPKDVVSGDFYWATPTPEGFIYITADCTGHGVPGAFMSLLNISKLSQTINENHILRPDLVLNNVRTEIINALNPLGSTEESKDGMDAVICKLDIKNLKLEFSAANNSFYILRNNELLNCKADKLSVGKGYNDSSLFTYNEIQLKKGDIIYTFTDGYADQFGGPRGKKFKYKQLEQLFLDHGHKTMNEQREILDVTFENWKGKLEQVDDVCVIGIRI